MHDTLAHYSKKLSINQSSPGFFLETISSAKGEKRTASADCKLGGFKHKIFNGGIGF
jgi:hypothetical protein